MRALGRMLQGVGLIALPLAIYLELTQMLDRAFGVSQLVFMMVFGVAAFLTGRIVEGYAVRS